MREVFGDRSVYTLDIAEEEILLRLCNYTSACPLAGPTLGELYEAYRYAAQIAGIDPLMPQAMFEDIMLGDGVNAGCSDGDPGGPPSVDPGPGPNDPNGGRVDDGGSIDDSGNGSDGGSNRGGRCSAQALTGSPSFEQFSSDPGECPSGSSIGIFDIDLYSGRWSKKSVDLAIPAEGFSWVISRSYNGAQYDRGTFNASTNQWEGAGYVSSNGIQGWNWRQDSMPTLRRYVATDPANDGLYLVLNADSYITFRREDGPTGDLWVGAGDKGGAVRRAVHSPSQYEYYEVYDLSGTKMSFFGFAGPGAGKYDGMLWKIEDAAGNIAYVGHPADPSLAASTGYSEIGAPGSGIYAIALAYDSSDREYTYAYTDVNDVGSGTLPRLESVTVHQDDTPMADEVARVEYTYYEAIDVGGIEQEEDHGAPGDLKMVRVVTPMSDGNELVGRTMYRYWKAGQTGGYEHAIKYIYESEGLRRADLNMTIGDGDPSSDDTSLLSASNTTLEPYASLYLAYISDSNRRVTEVWGQGECGCGTGTATPGSGTYTLSYTQATAQSLADDSVPWFMRTTIEYPEVTENSGSSPALMLERSDVHYFAAGGMRVAEVIYAGAPSTSQDYWATITDIRSADLGASRLTPAAVASFDYATGAFTPSADGLAYVYIPWEEADTSPSSIDDRNFGRTRFVAWKNGGDELSPVEDYLSETEYEFAELTVGLPAPSTSTVTVAQEFVSRTRRYPEGGTMADAAGYEQTTIDRTFHGSGVNDRGSVRPLSVTVTDPIVPTDENGAGTADSVTATYYREDGTLWWIEESDGVLSYMRYEDNVLVESVQDADTSLISDQPSGGLTSPLTPKHIKTVYTHDLQERMRTTTLPNGRVLNQHYGVLDDGQIVSIGFPGESGGDLLGPASFSLSGHNGIGLQSGRLAVGSGVQVSGEAGWTDETKSDARDSGFFGAGLTLVRLSESDYDSAGDKMTASRAWYDLNGPSGDRYDETAYGYDELGRVVAVRAPHGTISRTVYDAIGRSVGSYMGTNDSDFVSPLVAAGTGDMKRISTQVYDGGGSGNSLVTESTAHVTDSATRVTEYVYDARDRLVLTETPEAPFRVVAYDNLDRVTASAVYGVATNLTGGTDPLSYATDRLTLSETFYDTRGRAYRSKRHEIDQATGATGDAITEDRWYDEVGQFVKTTGSSLRKMRYDSLRRVIRGQTLARVNDTQYGDALDTLGDTVVSETVTHYDDDTGNVLTSMSLSRHPGDTGTGDLYGGSVDGSWEGVSMGGRPRISAMWYDALDRLEASVDYGTNGAVDFARSASAPARSDLDLPEIGHLTLYQYNGDGEIFWVQSPRDGVSTGGTVGADIGVITLTVFDDAGRVVQRTENYAPAAPATELDANRTVEIEYGNQTGLKIKEIAKNSDGTTNTDQVTTYIYGTTASATNPGTGHLLREVVYPDSAGGTDSVRYEYNWLSERTKQTDQAGNVIEYVYDDLGRVVEQDATMIATGFDDTVQSIETTYEARGLVASVTQLDDHDGTGSVLDSVTMTYDGWGLIEQSDQEPVAGDGVLDVEYSHVAVTDPSTRQTVRRAGITYPNNATAAYSYNTIGLDSDLSRVWLVSFDPNGASTAPEAVYTYGGVARRLQTMVFIPGGAGQSDAVCSRWDPTQPAPTGNADYTYLDRFDRVTEDTWRRRKDTSGTVNELDFVSFAIEYDVASNITRVNDTILGRDQVLMNDGLRRLVGETVNASALSTAWEYDKLGNWLEHSYADSSGVIDTADEFRYGTTVNTVNETLTRSLELSGAPLEFKDPTHDVVGNMTADGEGMVYKYDVFGRLTQISLASGSGPADIRAEFSYNGLHQRTVWREDRDGVAGLDDVEYHHVYDDRWRTIAIYRKDLSGTPSRDITPKEVTVYHAPGLDGRDGSGKLDEVIARYRHDDGSASTSPADEWADAGAILNSRGVYFQNWRGDVVAFYERGHMERIHYTPYGEPHGTVYADQDRDGDVDGADGA
ncbi:MAG: hypothetical protein AAGB48_08560, partial [Planctomycetota bacterium]